MHFSVVRLVPYQHIITNLGLFTCNCIYIQVYMHTLSINPLYVFPFCFRLQCGLKDFPSASYPSSHLGGVLGSVLKKTKNLFAEHADLKSFLQNHIDLDFVSPSLMKSELKRGHLLQEETDRAVTINTTQPSHPVTHEVIVDLENFRVREKLKDKFTTQWIRTLSGSTEADQVLVSNIKQMMTCYRSLVRKKGGVHDQKLAVFLATPFTVHTKADRHSCPKPAPPLLSRTEKLLSQTTKEKQRLQERVGNL